MEKEKENFKKYVKLKGQFLHMQIFDILYDWNDNHEVTYYELSSINRYDKNLRDTLYKYLALSEEKIRANLCDKYDITNDFVDENFEKWSINLVERNEIKDDSNLYYKLDIDFGKLIISIGYVKLFNENELIQISSIKKLRNKVMHHNLLIVGKAKSKDETIQEIAKIRNEIKDLYEFLPNDYKIGFETEINSLNFNSRTKEKYLNKLWLGEMINGICK